MLLEFILPFDYYKKGRCPQVVCLRVPGGSCPVIEQVWATPVPRFDRVGGLHLRPRPHTESELRYNGVSLNKKYFFITNH